MTNMKCKTPVNGADLPFSWRRQYGTMLLKLLAIPAGFEPATIGLEGRCRIPVYSGFRVNGLQQQTRNSFNNPGPM